MTVSNISQMALAKMQVYLWGNLKSTSRDSLAGNRQIWSLVHLTSHFLHPPNFIWWWHGKGWCLGFFFLTTMAISTRNGPSLSFRFDRKYMAPVAIPLLGVCCPRRQIKYLSYFQISTKWTATATFLTVLGFLWHAHFCPGIEKWNKALLCRSSTKLDSDLSLV